MPVFRSAVVMAFIAIASAHTPARGQDAATEARKAAQSKCATVKDESSPLRRFRIDGFTVDGDTVKVTGVFLRSGKVDEKEKEEDKQEIDFKEDLKLGATLTEVFNEVLKPTKKLSVNIDAITTIAVSKLPHYELQKAAIDGKRDEILIEPVTFDADGKAILIARVGSADDENWLIEKAKTLAKSPVFSRGMTTNAVSVQKEWKLGRKTLQKEFADSTGGLEYLNKIRLQRVRYELRVETLTAKTRKRIETP